jgi:glycerol uptake operon antiterminator
MPSCLISVCHDGAMRLLPPTSPALSPETAPRPGARAFLDLLVDDPVVASVKDDAGLTAALGSERRVVFVLFGSVLTIEQIVATAKAAGKTVLVDVDLLDGLAGRDVAVRFLAERTAVDGVLSSKAALVRTATSLGLVGVHRFFLVDSLAYANLPRQLAASRADAVEILPGCMPRVIRWLRDDVDAPIIAGGLVCDKDDVVAALGAGAVAVASSDHGVWRM